VNALEAVRAVERELAAAGVPDSRTDAEILVAHVLGTSRSRLHASDADVPAAQLERLRALVARRCEREPLQYILGEWGFRRLTLAVDRRALIPRPETEVVVERCLARIRDVEEPRVLDVGAGSGAIALALADEHPGARVTAVESSADALAVARENVRRTRLDGRVALAHGDLFVGLRGPFDLVVSNPPYVGEDEILSLEPEIRDYEPRGALVAPWLTEAVARGGRDVLRPGGWLVLECGDGRAAHVARLLRSLGYEAVTVTPDLAGTPRVVEGRIA
jgi:release factor glutamine methyltransferase